jgi:hypothetical protein
MYCYESKLEGMDMESIECNNYEIKNLRAVEENLGSKVVTNGSKY